MRFYYLLIMVFFVGFTTVNAQNYKFGKVSKEELLETAHPIEADANAAVLYRKTFTKFDYTQDDGFVANTEVHERIKIYNKDGYDWANKEVGLYQGKSDEELLGLKAVTYNLVDGKIKEEKLRNKGVFTEEKSNTYKIKKFTMPNIQDGSIIEYKYTLKTPFINNIDEFRFQESIPVNKVELTFFAPEYTDYKTHTRGWIPVNIQSDGRERTYRFQYSQARRVGDALQERGTSEVKIREKGFKVNLDNVPSLKDEPFSGNLDNYSSSLKFELAYTKFPNSPANYYATSWEDVARKIYKSEDFGGELEKTSYFKKDLPKVLEGATDPMEKAVRIFQFVKKKVTWNEYRGVMAGKGVKAAYKNGVGNAADINLMLTAMFREAGLNSTPVLLSTKANGIPVYPTRTGYDYVISGVQLNNGTYLFDATDKNGVPNILKPNLLNWMGRSVAKDGTSNLVRLEPLEKASHSSLIDIKINDDGAATGTVKDRFGAHLAKRKRNQYGNLSEDEFLDKLEAEYEILEIEDGALKNTAEYYKPLNIEYSFSSEDLVEGIDNKFYISPLAHLGISENYFKSEERKFPVDFRYPWQDRYSFSITIPDGFTTESLPTSLAMNLPNNMGGYKYAISQNGNKIQLMVQRVIKVSMIAPESYLDIKEFFKLVVEKEAEKIVLIKS